MAACAWREVLHTDKQRERIHQRSSRFVLRHSGISGPDSSKILSYSKLPRLLMTPYKTRSRVLGLHCSLSRRPHARAHRGARLKLSVLPDYLELRVAEHHQRGTSTDTVPFHEGHVNAPDPPQTRESGVPLPRLSVPVYDAGLQPSLLPRRTKASNPAPQTASSTCAAERLCRVFSSFKGRQRIHQRGHSPREIGGRRTRHAQAQQAWPEARTAPTPQTTTPEAPPLPRRKLGRAREARAAAAPTPQPEHYELGGSVESRAASAPASCASPAALPFPQ
ncbi:hypothetical protein P7K49_012021 [Saguinus oedipus]|uniref:Uncharacterized protein n=1 Tax=Saguinus oedipus TaxID=9490 RepID=A0ABQ9VSB4_SAGOE|nr:hypothetical protein P7K49_012021 [Saguinus oedipus]